MARPVAYEGTEPYIFISYAHKDSDRVLPIISDLQAQGFRVWYDAGIEAGTEWPEYIAEHLESCTVFLAFLSQSALDSPNCRREINFAIDERKEMLNIYLEELRLSAGMRMQLGVLQAMFCYRHSSRESFMEELCRSRILAPCRGTAVPPVRNPDWAAIVTLFEFTQTDDGGIEIKDLKDKTRAVVEIPWGVTSIGWCAFDSCANLIDITIPDSVTSIGGNAFFGCNNLANITIPDGVTSIGERAFWNCNNLTSITIPESVASIGENAFSGCRNLAEFVVSSNNPNYCSIDGILYTKHRKRLLAYPAGKQDASFVIPDSVTSIVDNVFWRCDNLTSITIPNSLTSIDEGIFAGCNNLTDFVVGANNPNYCSTNGILYTQNRTTLLAYPAGKCDTSFAIPDSVTRIGTRAFYLCSNLTNITVFDGVSSIGDSAFYLCKNLTGITIPDGVTNIDDFTFDSCYNLTSITIPGSVTSIGKWAFHLCKKLTSIAIPDGVTSIGNQAFSGCAELTSITIPDSVTSIGREAFSRCSNLTIRSKRGSVAERYAAENKIPFQAI